MLGRELRRGREVTKAPLQPVEVPQDRPVPGGAERKLQLGGAAGNLAALGEHGAPVMAGLAEELQLGCPVMPWHSQRDGLAELASWLSLLTGSLGKLGQDVLLLAQNGKRDAKRKRRTIGDASLELTLEVVIHGHEGCRKVFRARPRHLPPVRQDSTARPEVH